MNRPIVLELTAGSDFQWSENWEAAVATLLEELETTATNLGEQGKGKEASTSPEELRTLATELQEWFDFLHAVPSDFEGDGSTDYESEMRRMNLLARWARLQMQRAATGMTVSPTIGGQQ
jgi:uncharacterized protein YukE